MYASLHRHTNTLFAHTNFLFGDDVNCASFCDIIVAESFACLQYPPSIREV